ncbi:MAG: hypothetical protein GX892_16220 [Thermoanaerobacteraceae bacterium]|nr:hypothetical protein [Thermoanaerobacteraceae bacterium]
MRNLKITAYMLDGRVATVDGYLPLDGILAMAWMRKNRPELVGRPIDFNNFINAELPLKRCGQNDDWYWACSFACYVPLKENRRYWHKRFDQDMGEQYIDFGGRRGAINVKSGQYKNYRMPLNYILTPKIEWYAVGDKTEIELLLQYITHIGKKPSQGMGKTSKWTVEEWPEDLSWLRPIPDENGDDFTAIRPPYWYFENYRRVRWHDNGELGALRIRQETI